MGLHHAFRCLGYVAQAAMISRASRTPGSSALWVWLPALVLAGVVAIASFIPARLALIVNPLIIMRDDN